MLDPSTTPSKALFVFGPPKSGKSTTIRLMRSVAGDHNASSVSLQQLTDDPFGPANVAGKMLNTSADMSAAHMSDISTFKMLTGGLPLLAWRHR
jgi:putative DNA primase/helicase